MSENEFMDLIGDLKGQLEEKIVLEEMSKTILSTFDFDEVIVSLRDKTCELLECERATIYVVERGADGSGRELVSRTLVGEEVSEIRVPYNHFSIAGSCACSGRVVRIANVYDDDELGKLAPTPTFDKSWDAKTGFTTRSMLVAPCRKGDYIVGVLQVLNKRTGEFSEHDESLILKAADLVSQAIGNNRGQTAVSQKKRVTVNELLVGNELISEVKLKEAIARSQEEQVKLQDILVEQYDVPEKEIVKCMSEVNGTEFFEFDPDETSIDPYLFDNVPEAYARRHIICPLKLTMDANGDQQMHLVMHNPKDFIALEDVEIRTGCKVKHIYMATRSDIIAMINHTLHPDSDPGDEPEEAMGELLNQLSEQLGISEEDIETVKIDEGSTEDDGPIVRLANRIIEEAVRKSATDIHVEPKETHVLVRYRVDGSLEKAMTFPSHAKSAIVSRLKIMAECNITERRVPQDGRIRFKEFGGRYDIELRVNICPTVGGNEDVVMRILADSKPLPLEKLGLYPYTFDPLVEAVQRPYGMILCVGPTGSGKTTTLHSTVAHINTPERKILTAENPVEITQDGLRQVQIKSEVGLTFKEALRAFLRQDPDVILVGEMRDFETCSIAVEAALTGHLLLSTLHTNNAPETITRLVDIGIDPVTLSDALLVVVAQRLAKTLCKKCKEKYDPEQEELDKAGIKFENGIYSYRGREYPEAEFYNAVGCDECQGRGYKGRVGLHELLNNNDEITRLIATAAKVAEIRDQAVECGMRELYEDGMIKVMDGLTSINQIRAVCTE